MTKKRAIIPSGTTVFLSEGEYSNYHLIVLCKTLSDLCIEDLLEEYYSLNENERVLEENYRWMNPYGRLKTYKFVKWLMVDKGLLEELDYQELYLGSYGSGNVYLRELEDWKQEVEH